MKLFSQEALEITKNIRVEVVKPKKTTRTPRNKEPSASDIKWERRKSMERLAELEAQDETGWSESDIWYKGKDNNMPLVKNHIIFYTKQLKEMRAKFMPLLNRWKTFILDYCKEKGQEVEHIWFDESVPYDVCVEVRMKNHRCWFNCVSFRFQDGKLKAYDSHFGGGTSFVWFNHLDYANLEGHLEGLEKSKVKEVMDKVFAMACSNSKWCDGDGKQKQHKFDEDGWII